MKRYTDSIDDRLTGRHKKCIEFCGDLKGKRILDIGCYNGWFEQFAAESACMEAVGIDVNESKLLNDRAQVTGKNVRFLKASVLNLSQFGSKYFDLVTMFDITEHLPKSTEEECLLEVKRVLKNDGTLVMSTPNNSFFSKILDPVWYFGHRHYSKDYIVKLLSKVGFGIEKVGYGGGFYELFSMILLYIFKWLFHREIPFKDWFERRREKEYLETDKAFVTLFIKARY